MSYTIEQNNIINHDFTKNPSIAVLAGAGVGKSYTVVGLVEKLIKQDKVKANKLLLTSFSRTANKELYEKTSKAVGEKVDDMTISTIHAIMFRFLVKIQKEIGYEKSLDVVDNLYYAKIIHNQGIKDINDDFDYKEALKIANGVSWNKANNEIVGEYRGQKKDLILYAEETLRKQNKITYADMLYLGYKHLSAKKEYQDMFDFDYILIDEFQDTSKIQLMIIDLMIKKHTRTVFTGDVKQNIYGFINAKFQYSAQMIKKHKSDTYYLSETFRFGQKIADFANLITTQIKGVDAKYLNDTQTNVKVNNEISYNYMNEDNQVSHIVNDLQQKIREGVKLSDYTILYRINKESLPFQKALAKLNIPFVVAQGSFLNRHEVKFLFSVIEVMESFDYSAFIQIVKQYNNNVGEKIIKSCYNHAEDKESIHSILKAGISKKIDGIGIARKNGLRQLDTIFSQCREVINHKDLDNKIHRLALALDIDNTSFMDKGENIEGVDNNQERWEFIASLNDSCKTQNLHEFVNEMKVEYMGSDGDNKKEAVNLKTVHSAKGMSLPYTQLLLNKFGAFVELKEGQDINDDMIPSQLRQDINDELFVYYVASTRASIKLNLYLDKSPDKFIFKDTLPIVEDPEILEQLEAMDSANLLYPDSDLSRLKANFNKLTGLKQLIGIVEMTTEKAIQFTMMDKKVWVPKSQVAFGDDDKFYIPNWLKKKLGAR